MVQAAVLDGLLVDAPPFGQDGIATAEVDVSQGQVVDALVVAMVVVVGDERGDGGLKCAFEEVVFQENAVLEGLVLAFVLALGLGMHRRTGDVLHAFVLEVLGQIVGEVGRAVANGRLDRWRNHWQLAEKAGFV